MTENQWLLLVIDVENLWIWDRNGAM